LRKISTIITIVFLLVAIFSCSQGYLVNMNAHTNYSEGRDLYMSKCGGCHQLFNPSNYTKDEWNKNIVVMQKKSKIDDDQKNEILNWILETKQNEENIGFKNK